MRNYFQDDDRLEADECPCANHIDGADPDCPQHSWEIQVLAGGEYLTHPDDQYDADMALIWPIIAEELGVPA